MKRLILLLIICFFIVFCLYACGRYAYISFIRSQGVLIGMGERISDKSENYRKDRNSVYYAVDLEEGRPSGLKIPADLSSFEVLSEYYAKDKNSVFYEDDIVPYADPKTFVYLGCDLGKDAQYVFYDGKRVYTKINERTVPLVTDIATLAVQEKKGECVLHDKNGVYLRKRYFCDGFDTACFLLSSQQLDLDTLEKVWPVEGITDAEDILRDKNGVYLCNEKLDVDLATFHYESPGDYSDKNGKYKHFLCDFGLR